MDGSYFAPFTGARSAADGEPGRIVLEPPPEPHPAAARPRDARASADHATRLGPWPGLAPVRAGSAMESGMLTAGDERTVNADAYVSRAPRLFAEWTTIDPWIAPDDPSTAAKAMK